MLSQCFAGVKLTGTFNSIITIILLPTADQLFLSAVIFSVGGWKVLLVICGKWIVVCVLYRGKYSNYGCGRMVIGRLVTLLLVLNSEKRRGLNTLQTGEKKSLARLPFMTEQDKEQ